jgi:hypothetical protein
MTDLGEEMYRTEDLQAKIKVLEEENAKQKEKIAFLKKSKKWNIFDPKIIKVPAVILLISIAPLMIIFKDKSLNLFYRILHSIASISFLISLVIINPIFEEKATLEDTLMIIGLIFYAATIIVGLLFHFDKDENTKLVIDSEEN